MAKKTYADIVQQIEGLKAEAERLRKDEVEGVVARIREAIAAYELTADDLFGGKKPRATRRAPIARKKKAGKAVRAAAPAAVAKYSNPEGGTWGGRGPRPQWLRDALANGANLEDFRTKA
ncbi:MAG TPA: H-NS histone family protein [Variovorax sp.]|nr:H-NS histone family protein [Variovorax sp.]